MHGFREATLVQSRFQNSEEVKVKPTAQPRHGALVRLAFPSEEVAVVDLGCRPDFLRSWLTLFGCRFWAV